MTIKLNNQINVLIEAVINTEDYETFIDLIKEYLQEINESLQFIGDANKFETLEVALLTLYRVCPVDKEEHLLGCLGLYQGILTDAWENYDENVLMALKSIIGEGSDEVSHLEKCLKLDSQSSETYTL